MPKLDDLYLIAETQNPSMICIVESWLSDEIIDCELSIENYTLTRLDRNRHGGGLLVYVHASLNWEILLEGSELEFLALSISSPCDVKHCVSLLYRPPSAPVSSFDKLFTILHELAPFRFASFVLIGDFNVDICNIEHSYYYKLQSIIETLSLSQVVRSPTHTNSNSHASLIYLALVSNKALLLDCSVIPPLSNSEHNGLELCFKWKHCEKQICAAPRIIWQYKDANYIKACQMAEETDWDTPLHEDDIDRSAINWHKRFMEIMIACISRKSLRRRRNLPWLTKNIIQHIRKRNAAFQAAKNSAKTEKYSKFRKLRNEVVSMLRNAKSSYFKKINPHNKKQFWKSIKYLSKQQSGIPALHHHDKIAESDYEKASMLNEFFSTCFNTAVPPLSMNDDDFTVQNDRCPEELLCSDEEVLYFIMSMDLQKANGPDGISAKMLKGVAYSITPSLTRLFNISIVQGRVPECWKSSSVVPIPK